MGSTNPMVQHAQFFGLLGHPGCQERTSTKFWRQFRFFLTIAAKTINYGPRSNFIVALEKMQKSRIYIHLLYWLYQYLGFFLVHWYVDLRIVVPRIHLHNFASIGKYHSHSFTICHYYHNFYPFIYIIYFHLHPFQIHLPINSKSTLVITYIHLPCFYHQFTIRLLNRRTVILIFLPSICHPF